MFLLAKVVCHGVSVEKPLVYELKSFAVSTSCEIEKRVCCAGHILIMRHSRETVLPGGKGGGIVFLQEGSWLILCPYLKLFTFCYPVMGFERSFENKIEKPTTTIPSLILSINKWIKLLSNAAQHTMFFSSCLKVSWFVYLNISNAAVGLWVLAACLFADS